MKKDIKRGDMCIFNKPGHKYDGSVMRVVGITGCEPGPMSSEKPYKEYTMKRIGAKDARGRPKRGIDAKARRGDLTVQPQQP